MYVVAVEFGIDPAQWDAFLPLMLENARVSREQEPGCRQFDVCADAERRVVFLYEIYDDRGAFDLHLASPHFRHFADAAKSMIVKRTISTWRRIGP